MLSPDVGRNWPIRKEMNDWMNKVNNFLVTKIFLFQELPRVLVNVVSQLQYILGSEQNQQMLCEAGLPLLLLKKCKEAFMDDDHPLNAAMTKLFERLTSQSVEPDVFR